MKKILMVLALALGTTVMVNAQTAPAKEIKTTKHEHKKEHKKEVKATDANTTAAVTKPATTEKK